MSKNIRRKVVEVLKRGIRASGPDHYRLDCGHEWLGYARTKPALVGIEIIHPKTARCVECESERAREGEA